MNNDSLPTPTTPEGIGVLLWAMQRQMDEHGRVLEALTARLAIMVTHDDIRGLRHEIAELAKSKDVDTKIEAVSARMNSRIDLLQADLNRTKPATLGKQLVMWCVGITTVLTCGGLLLQIAGKLDHVIATTQGAVK